jgi:hypothetical protein
MAVSKSKKRFQVSLTPANVDRFQSLVQYLGLPANTMSMLCDDAIKGMSDVLQTAKEKGSIDIEDIEKLMGKQVELFREEERKQNDVLQ